MHGAGQDLLAVRTADGREVLVPVRVRARAGRRRGRRAARGRRPARAARRPLPTRTASRVRIDVVSIFPDYLAPLELSLAGKAQDAGLLDVHVHDLRDWTHDRHRTVDDTPYGGGAGMVMRPEPWGEALDAAGPSRTPAAHRAGRARPRRRAVHPGGRRRARARRAPGVRLRPLRGHRPAGARRGRDPDDGPRGLARRLRAQRWGGRRAGGDRGGRPAAARLHGQPRVADRGVARRGRACWSTPSTPSPPPGAATTSRRCCCPATTRGSPRGATTRRYVGRPQRRPDLLHPSRHARRRGRGGRRPHRDPGRRRRAAHPAARVLGHGGAAPTPRSTSRRCARTSTTCWPGWRRGPRSSYARGSGWSARCAAAARRRDAGTSAG